MRGVRLVAVAMVLSSSSFAAEAGGVVKCRALGSWHCGDKPSPESICIDGREHEGEVFRIDFNKLRLTGPSGTVALTPTGKRDQFPTWGLSNGGRLEAAGKVFFNAEHRERDVYDLYESENPREIISLKCDPLDEG